MEGARLGGDRPQHGYVLACVRERKFIHAPTHARSHNNDHHRLNARGTVPLIQDMKAQVLTPLDFSPLK